MTAPPHMPTAKTPPRLPRLLQPSQEPSQRTRILICLPQTLFASSMNVEHTSKNFSWFCVHLAANRSLPAITPFRSSSIAHLVPSEWLCYGWAMTWPAQLMLIGQSVWDPEGNKFTDMLSAYGSAFISFSDPYSFPTLCARIVELTLLCMPRGTLILTPDTVPSTKATATNASWQPWSIRPSD